MKALYVSLKDNATAFDTVKHAENNNIMEGQTIDGKDLRVKGKCMYWKQTAVVRVKNEISYNQDLKTGVRQGCVLSSELFSMYNEKINEEESA